MSKKDISLVLGSGGARGYAHIGAIEALEEMGFNIVSISGSSMGALVGGLYAAKALDAYKNWVIELDIFDVIKLLDFSFTSDGGIINGDKVIEKLRGFIKGKKIEELEIEFTAVATNLRHQRSVWFKKGDLLDAIRASIAMPTIFTPKEINGELYLDGGILSPLPTTPLLSTACPTTVAVNLNGKEEPGVLVPPVPEQNRIINYIKEAFFNQNEDSFNSFKIISKSIEMMQRQLIKYELANHEPDLIIDIPINVADFYDFHRAKEIIEFGKRRAVETLKRSTLLD